LGRRELAFRLWSSLFSVGALLAFAQACRRLLSPAIAIAALLLVAASAGLVQHAHEFKPFSFESCVTMLFLTASLGPASRRVRGAQWVGYLILFLLSPIAVFLAFLPV